LTEPQSLVERLRKLASAVDGDTIYVEEYGIEHAAALREAADAIAEIDYGWPGLGSPVGNPLGRRCGGRVPQSVDHGRRLGEWLNKTKQAQEFALREWSLFYGYPYTREGHTK
jgi:hypothetical protein